MSSSGDYPPNYLKPWTRAEEEALAQGWEADHDVQTLADALGRTPGGIVGRLQKIFGYAYDDMPPRWDGRPRNIRGCPNDDEPERNSGMERNIAAMMHEDALTVRVKFQQRQAPEGYKQPAQKDYTYITTQVLAPGDLVVVYAAGTLQVAEVTAMDTVLDIEPNAGKEYEWIVQKLDTKPYELQQHKNEKLKSLVKEHYKLNARAQMRDLILGQLDGPAKKAALELLK